jgi:signal transduction histidine kinase
VTRLPVPISVLLATIAAVMQASAGAPEDVQALVARATEHIRQYGREQAFEDFNRPDGGFVNGELYVFCIDGAGIQLANGGNPKLVGKNLSSLRDAEGKATTADMYHIGQTQGQGWYEYLWPNTARHRIERKVAFVVRIDDQTVCASGYYKSDPP